VVCPPSRGNTINLPIKKLGCATQHPDYAPSPWMGDYPPPIASIVMDLVADDRERGVIVHLEQLCAIRITRMTVGDYAFVSKAEDRVVLIVERKSLSDLAASIKDGRIDNHETLLNAREESGCRIMYLVEGPSYPGLDRKFGGILFKCLQGKLDNLMLRDNVQVVWTRDEAHTARRLAGYRTTLSNIVKKQTAPTPSPVCEAGAQPARVEPPSDGADPGGASLTLAEPACIPCANAIIQPKRAPAPVEYIQMRMLCTLKGVSRATAKLFLQHHDLVDILQDPDPKALSELVYESGFRVGETRAMDFTRRASNLSADAQRSAAFLACIDRVSMECAQLILSTVPIESLIGGNFPEGQIAEVRRGPNGRRLGKCMEASVRNAFAKASGRSG
jgi:hypothetical protein